MGTERRYVIQGIDPSTDRLVELLVLAANEIDAKTLARGSGLQMVAVSEFAGDRSRPPRDAAERQPTVTQFILVVDDHPEMRAAMARLLIGDGYPTVTVADRIETLAILETARPSLIITDFMMPGCNGLTLFNEIRGNVRFSTIPFLMFSAFNGEIRAAALRAGVDAFVIKDSLDWAQLKSEIHRLAGPGMLRQQRLPKVPSARAKDAG